jgi:hypothetical protein
VSLPPRGFGAFFAFLDLHKDSNTRRPRVPVPIEAKLQRATYHRTWTPGPLPTSNLHCFRRSEDWIACISLVQSVCRNPIEHRLHCWKVIVHHRFSEVPPGYPTQLILHSFVVDPKLKQYLRVYIGWLPSSSRDLSAVFTRSIHRLIGRCSPKVLTECTLLHDLTLHIINTWSSKDVCVIDC